jgi:hypothetical protein
MLEQGCQLKSIDEVLRKEGCYVFAIARMVEMERKLNLCDYLVQQAFMAAVNKGFVKADATVLNGAKFYNLLAGANVYQGVYIAPSCSKPYYPVCNVKKGFTHFTLMTPAGVWDSLPPDRPQAKAYRLESVRVFE